MKFVWGRIENAYWGKFVEISLICRYLVGNVTSMNHSKSSSKRILNQMGAYEYGEGVKQVKFGEAWKMIN